MPYRTADVYKLKTSEEQWHCSEEALESTSRRNEPVFPLPERRGLLEQSNLPEEESPTHL